MKKLYPILLSILCVFGIVACRTNGVYDPVKTAKVQAAIRPITAALVRAEATAQPQNVPYIRALGRVFCQMQTNADFSPKYLTAEIDKLGSPFIHDQLVMILKDTIISLYTINYEDRFRAELAPDRWPIFLAELLCNGISSGLAGIPE